MDRKNTHILMLLYKAIRPLSKALGMNGASENLLSKQSLLPKAAHEVKYYHSLFHD